MNQYSSEDGLEISTTISTQMSSLLCAEKKKKKVCKVVGWKL